MPVLTYPLCYHATLVLIIGYDKVGTYNRYVVHFRYLLTVAHLSTYIYYVVLRNRMLKVETQRYFMLMEKHTQHTLHTLL